METGYTLDIITTIFQSKIFLMLYFLPMCKFNTFVNLLKNMKVEEGPVRSSVHD